MSGHDTKKEATSDKLEQKPREDRAEKAALPAIDFAKLDLTVEKVEERISPSETNVFDK